MAKVRHIFRSDDEAFTLDIDSLLHPALAFDHPEDVVRDADLTLNEKRAILASWASDACAVESAPALRIMGNGNPISFDEVIDAFARTGRGGREGEDENSKSMQTTPESLEVQFWRGTRRNEFALISECWAGIQCGWQKGDGREKRALRCNHCLALRYGDLLQALRGSRAIPGNNIQGGDRRFLETRFNHQHAG